jgi:MFS family permease
VIALLLLVITLIHLDRFDTDSLFGVFWVVAYVLVPLLLAWALADQLSDRGDPVQVTDRLPGVLRRALMVEGVVLVAVGALLLIAPSAADDVWPWALSPLTSRAIGAFLLGIGVAALLAARDDDPLSFRGAAAAYTALGLLQLLALNLHIPDLGHRPLATGVYAAFWVAVVLTGGYGLRAARASARS